MDEIFLHALGSSTACATNFVNVVLETQTPLNASYADGRSFCLSTKINRHDIVDFIISQKPSPKILQKAFMAIFDSSADETSLMTLAKKFFRHREKDTASFFQYDDPATDAFYQVVHRHPEKSTLLQLLLDNGCHPKSRFSWTFETAIGPEDTSPLLWSLCQGEINQKIIMILLEQKGRATLPY